MPLKLNDLIVKASKKGFKINTEPNKNVFVKPWQSESLLYIDKQKKEKPFSTPKPISNQHQSGAKTNTKPTPNNHQTNTKPTPQKNKPISNQHQSDVQSDTKIDTKQAPNQYQTNINIGFFSLTGLQREITIFIYNLCKLSRDKKTDAVSIAYVSMQCKSTVGAVKVAIYRLIEKGIIQREEFKNGRGGWTVYSIPNGIYQEIINTENNGKLVSNWHQNDIKLITELVSKVTPSFSSSSSTLNILKTTTTGELEKYKFEDEWLNMDFEPLINIGFTEAHLKQLATQKILTIEQVQNSIYAFAFDLEYNDKENSIKGNPLNFFIGILRRGSPYNYPQNYESPKDREMRIYVERLKEIEQRRAVMEKEAFELGFKEWFYDLTEEEGRKLMPAGIKYAKESKMTEGAARKYFSQEVWINKFDAKL